jgi:hypothetical protein
LGFEVLSPARAAWSAKAGGHAVLVSSAIKEMRAVGEHGIDQTDRGTQRDDSAEQEAEAATPEANEPEEQETHVRSLRQLDEDWLLLIEATASGRTPLPASFSDPESKPRRRSSRSLSEQSGQRDRDEFDKSS